MILEFRMGPGPIRVPNRQWPKPNPNPLNPNQYPPARK